MSLCHFFSSFSRRTIIVPIPLISQESATFEAYKRGVEIAAASLAHGIERFRLHSLCQWTPVMTECAKFVLKVVVDSLLLDAEIDPLETVHFSFVTSPERSWFHGRDNLILQIGREMHSKLEMEFFMMTVNIDKELRDIFDPKRDDRGHLVRYHVQHVLKPLEIVWEAHKVNDY